LNYEKKGTIECGRIEREGQMEENLKRKQYGRMRFWQEI